MIIQTSLSGEPRASHSQSPDFVPGVLSSNGGRDFGSFLGAVEQLGYGFAYRVLDAQNFGVPQRRRRVFVVGHLGDWRRAAAVLFEPESLCGDPSSRRQAKQDIAGTVTSGAGRRRGSGIEPESVVATLDANYGRLQGCSGQDACHGHSHLIAHTLKGEGFDASEDGTGRGTPLVPVTYRIHSKNSHAMREGGTAGVAAEVDIARCLDQNGGWSYSQGGNVIAFDTTQITSQANRSNPQPGGPCHPLARGAHPPAIAFTCKDHGQDCANDMSPTLRSMGGTGPNGGGQVAIAFQSSQSGVRTQDVHATLDSNNGSRRHNGVIQGHAVRRLTPRECERLQGFPDDWTQVPHRSKPAADGPRYKAIGNSMAVPVMAWIGRRIKAIGTA